MILYYKVQFAIFYNKMLFDLYLLPLNQSKMKYMKAIDPLSPEEKNCRNQIWVYRHFVTWGKETKYEYPTQGSL